MTNALVPYNGGIQIIQRHSMFDLHGRTAKIVEYRHQSIEDLFRTHMPANMACTCSLDGQVIPRDEWPLTMVAPNDCVLFTPILHGGGGGGNKGLQIVGALLIIAAVVLYCIPGLQGAGILFQGLGMSLLVPIATVALTMGAIGAGLLLLGMMPSLPALPSMPGVQASITGWSPQTTQAQGGCLPKYYGEHKLFGNIIATYITDATVDGKEVQYLYALIDLGMGPYDSLSNFKINNIVTTTLQQVSIVARNGYLSQDLVPGFEKTPVNYTESQLMLYGVPVVRQTTGTDFDKLTVRMLFPQGLGIIDGNGKMGDGSVELEVKIKRSVDSDWIYLATEAQQQRIVTTPGQWKCIGWGGVIVGYGDSNPGSQNEGALQDYGDYGVGRWTWIAGTTAEKLGIVQRKTITNATRNRVPVDFEYEIPADKKGRYDISVTRLTVDTTDIKVADKVSYVGHTETEYDEFTYPRQVLVGVRALLTDQISGSFKFSCHAKASLIHVYDSGSDTWTPQWSNNPAWIAYDVLTSPVFYDSELGVPRANQRTAVARYDGADPDRIDLDSVVAFAAFCDEQLMEGHDQIVAVVQGESQKYKCLKTHTAADNIKPGVDYYVDKIPPVSLGVSAVGTISSSIADLPGYEAWRAFDHVSEGWKPNTADESWIQFQFVLPTRIRRYSVAWANGTAYATDWVFEGRYGGSWVSLHSVNGFTGDGVETTHTYTFTNDTAYEQYRLRITENTHVACLVELEMFDADESWQTYWEATNDGSPTTWSSGMRYYVGTEPRYTFNGGFDTRNSRWTAAMQVCASAQAAIVTVGTRIYFVVDTVKIPSQLITEGNLISFKEQFMDLSNRATEIDAEFKNAEKDYENDNVTAFLSNTPDMFNKMDIKPTGLTKASEVWRLAKHHVVQNQKRRICEVEMDIDTIASMIGDVVYLQSETPDWESSRGGIVIAATSNTITLDREVIIESGISYTIMVRLASTNGIVTKNITASMAPGSHSVLTLADANWGGTNPDYGDIFAFGELDKVVKTFSIINIVPTKNHGATLTLLEYDADLYAQIDNTSPEIRQENQIAHVRYVKIVSLVLAENTYFDTNGNLVRNLEATWVPSISGPAYSRGKVYIRVAVQRFAIPNAWILAGDTEDTTFLISPVADAVDYEVMIVGVDSMGLTAPLESEYTVIASLTSAHAEDGTDYVPTDVTNFTVTLSGQFIDLAWAAVNNPSISGYRITLNGDVLVDQYRGTRYIYKGALDVGVYDFDIVAINILGQISGTPMEGSITIEAPHTPAPSSAIGGNTVVISWADCETSLPISHYTMNGTNIGPGHTYQTRINWTGAQEFAIIAVDIAGNVSAEGSCEVTVASIGAITALTPTGSTYAIILAITGSIPVNGCVEIWSAANNDRVDAIKIGESTSGVFTHGGLPLVATRYYWARMKDQYGTFGAWYPATDEGVAGNTSMDPADYLSILTDAISESQLASVLRGRMDLIDTDIFVMDESVVEDNILGGMYGAFCGLAMVQTSQVGTITGLQTLANGQAATIIALQSEIQGLTTTTWSNTESYTIGRYVIWTSNDVGATVEVYRCIQAYVYPDVYEPGIDIDYWEEADALVHLYASIVTRVDDLETGISTTVSEATFNLLDNRVTDAESVIDQHAADILLRTTQDEFNNLVVPLYDDEATYNTNDNVRYNYSGALWGLYRCKYNNVRGIDPTNATYWEAKPSLASRQTVAEINISAANAAISLKASETSMSALETRVDSAEVNIDAANSLIELKASISAVTAIDSRVGNAEVTIAAGQNGSWSSISSKATTATVDALSLRVGSAESNIVSLQSADGTLQSSINLKVSTSTYNAKMSLLDGSISTIGGRIGAAEVTISSLQSADGTLQSNINNKVSITTYDAKVANLDGSISTLGGRTATAESNIGVLQTASGNMQAQYTVKLNVNGRVAGFGLMLNEVSSDFIIVADKFAIVNPGNNGDTKVPFVVGNVNGVSTVGIAGNLVVDGTILARHIAANQLTVGENVAMGANATISWTKVTGGPNVTYINESGLYTGTIEANKINAGSLNSNVIYTGTLTATQINVSGINASNITTGTLNVDVITANSITSGKINDLNRVKVTDPTVIASGTYHISGGIPGTILINTNYHSTNPEGWDMAALETFIARVQIGSGWEDGGDDHAIYATCGAKVYSVMGYMDVDHPNGFSYGYLTNIHWGEVLIEVNFTHLAGNTIRDCDINWALMKV
jgi:predicted phage tail protein